MLAQLFESYGPRHFVIRFWDKSELPAEKTPSRFTLVINEPRFLSLLMSDPSNRTLGEAYAERLFEIEGDLRAAIALGDVFVGTDRGRRGVLALVRRLLGTTAGMLWRHPQAFHSKYRLRDLERTKEAISFHYDLPVEFWQLWLDPQLLYTCGYFASPEMSLDDAQTAKLEMICRKLGLCPGDELLDIGCGWGGLICYAAKHYGVKTTGITLSQRQADHARALIARENMEHLCRVELRDFRDMEEMERFDKITGIGVIEHVGEAQLEYFRRAWRLLRPSGRFLNQGITTAAGNKQARPGESFIDAYVFPDARLVPISRTVAAAEAAGFELRDIESLREHYVNTTSCWLQHFEASQAEICKIIDEQMFRRFRLALAGFCFEFERGQLNLYQTLFVKTAGGESGMPRTRALWYASGDEAR